MNKVLPLLFSIALSSCSNQWNKLEINTIVDDRKECVEKICKEQKKIDTVDFNDLESISLLMWFENYETFYLFILESKEIIKKNMIKNRQSNIFSQDSIIWINNYNEVNDKVLKLYKKYVTNSDINKDQILPYILLIWYNLVHIGNLTSEWWTIFFIKVTWLWYWKLLDLNLLVDIRTFSDILWIDESIINQIPIRIISFSDTFLIKDCSINRFKWNYFYIYWNSISLNSKNNEESTITNEVLHLLINTFFNERRKIDFNEINIQWIKTKPKTHKEVDEFLSDTFSILRDKNELFRIILALQIGESWWYNRKWYSFSISVLKEILTNLWVNIPHLKMNDWCSKTFINYQWIKEYFESLYFKNSNELESLVSDKTIYIIISEFKRIAKQLILETYESKI